MHAESQITPRWIGNLLRRRLRLTTYKSHGVYVLPLSEGPKLEILWQKYGITSDALGGVTQLPLSRGDGDMGMSQSDLETGNNKQSTLKLSSNGTADNP